jgi:hypothetical protein
MKFYELAKLVEVRDVDQETLVKLVKIAVSANNFCQMSGHGLECISEFSDKCDCGYVALQEALKDLLG